VGDFDLRRMPKRARDEWDEGEEESEAPDPAAINLSRLITEFVGYMRREEGVPFGRGQLMRGELHSYFVERQEGRLDPRPSMLDQVLRPERKLPKPPRPAHPLCPERVTLEVFLAKLVQGFVGRHYVAAGVFLAIPAWLRFLESRRLIDSNVRRKVAKELLPLHATLSQLWQRYQDDPTLGRDVQDWPADAEKGPSESLNTARSGRS
jgi:hypothetical protein